MNHEDLSNHNLADGPGGQPGSGADMPGFLADKLGLFTVEAAPDSYADIKARLRASRRRGGFWLWPAGAFLLVSILLGLLWQHMSPATKPTAYAIEATNGSAPKAPKNMPDGGGEVAQSSAIDVGIADASTPAAIASQPISGNEMPEAADQGRDASPSSKNLPMPAHLGLAQASTVPATSNRTKAVRSVASSKPNNSMKATIAAVVSKGSASPNQYTSTPHPTNPQASNPQELSPEVDLKPNYGLNPKAMGKDAPTLEPSPTLAAKDAVGINATSGIASKSASSEAKPNASTLKDNELKGLVKANVSTIDATSSTRTDKKVAQLPDSTVKQPSTATDLSSLAKSESRSEERRVGKEC